jgi:hypothetical protein
VIRQGGLAVAMVIHVLELSNPILVCIREGSRIIGSAIGNGKGVKGNCKELVCCTRVVKLSPQITEGLMNNIILLEKENAFNHMGECIKMAQSMCFKWMKTIGL